MADQTRHVYLKFQAFAVGPPEEMLPDLGISATEGGELTALAFVVPDGEGQEAHVFVLTEEMKREIVSRLTGGVQLPPQIALPAGLRNGAG